MQQTLANLQGAGMQGVYPQTVYVHPVQTNTSLGNALYPQTWYLPTTANVTVSSDVPTVTRSTLHKKEASMKLVRYIGIYPNPHVAKVDPMLPVLLDGIAMVSGNDEHRIILDVSNELDLQLKELNENLTKYTWINQDGDQKPFATVVRSDIQFEITVLKSY